MEENVSVTASAKKNDVKWYVACTRSKQEFKIKEKLDSLGVENFLASREEVRFWKDRRKKVRVCLIPGVIFIKMDKSSLLDLHNKLFLPISFMRSLTTRQLLVVPDKQMEDFMMLVMNDNDELELEMTFDFVKGAKVRVVRGTFFGLEGELVEYKGKKKVMVRLAEGLGNAVVSIAHANLINI